MVKLAAKRSKSQLNNHRLCVGNTHAQIPAYSINHLPNRLLVGLHDARDDHNKISHRSILAV